MQTETSPPRIWPLIVVTGVLATCIAFPCGVGVGWFGKGSAASPLTPENQVAKFEGVYHRIAPVPIGDAKFKKIELKPNGIIVVDDNLAKVAKYQINKDVLTIEQGAGNLVGEFEGENLRLQEMVFSKKKPAAP
jgi:hypothetical protein